MRFGIGFVVGAIIASYLFCGRSGIHLHRHWLHLPFPIIVSIVIVCAILGGIALITIWKDE